MTPSYRSLEAWVIEIGYRATVAVAEENSWFLPPSREAAVVRRATEARARARARRP